MTRSFDKKFKSLKELKSWQEKTLISFVNYALENGPFYKKRNYPKNIKDIKEFKKLPFFSGDEYKKYNEEFLTNPSSLWRVFATSGTTGKPKLSFYGDDLIESYVIGIGDMLERAGINLEDKNNVGCILFPMGGLTGSGPSTARALEGLKIPAITLGIDVNPEFGSSIMKKIKPNFIFMYPSTFNVFSDKIEKTVDDLKEFKIKAIFSGGEPLLPNIRANIKERWGADVFNLTGSVDISNFTGTECKEHDGFHIFARNAYFEIVDDNGNAVKDGEEGELVLTSLVNKTMPFIRYRTKDIFKYSEEPCKCGLITPRIWFKKRKDDLIILSGAAKIFPQDVAQIVSKFSELTSDYQIKIENFGGKDKLTFIFESRQQSKELEKNIAEALTEISSLYRKIYTDKTVLFPIVKLVPINQLERNRGKLKNRIVDLREKGTTE